MFATKIESIAIQPERSSSLWALITVSTKPKTVSLVVCDLLRTNIDILFEYDKSVLLTYDLIMACDEVLKY